MNALVAGLVGVAFLILFAICLIGVRRLERDVDYASFGRDKPDDDQLHLMARVIANVTVASP